MIAVSAFAMAWLTVSDQVTAGDITPERHQSTRHQARSTTSITERFAAISREAQARVGVIAELLESGEAVALNEDERFPMQSVYKLPIAMAVLHLVDRGVLKFDQIARVDRADYVLPTQHSPLRDGHPDGAAISIRDLLRLMVSDSDGSACDVLLRLAGGPGQIMRFLRELGALDVIVATTEKAMGRDETVQYRNWATPKGVTRLLRLFYAGHGLSDKSRSLLLQWMRDSPTGPHRIRGLLPTGTVVAHKTGSSRTVDGLARATNDVGIVTLPDGRHLVVAVFVADSRADEASRDRVIAQVARNAWDYWAR